jgi:hypothetical protein
MLQQQKQGTLAAIQGRHDRSGGRYRESDDGPERGGGLLNDLELEFRKAASLVLQGWFRNGLSHVAGVADLASRPFWALSKGKDWALGVEAAKAARPAAMSAPLRRLGAQGS